jgi:DNA-binding response OmpR family regulator
MANERVLIIEDDIDLSGIIKDYLVKEGFEVKQAFSGKNGIDYAANFKPSLIILDIMLPQVDGIEVCRMIRLHSHVPILIISAKSSDYDKVVSLGVGADDYLTKPFSLIELIARVKSHLRRYTYFAGEQNRNSEPEETRHICGKLVIDIKSYTVTADGKDIPFTSKEFKLLNYLSQHPATVFSKEQLMDNVWGFNEYIDENTIAVYIGRIREKLAKQGLDYIKTVWGVGYKWQTEN